MITAEQFERAWRQGQRRFDDVDRVEVSPEFIAAWERRTRGLRHERDAWIEHLAALPQRRGNSLRQRRVDEIDAELWQLALIRDRVQTINARALPSPPGPARRADAVAARTRSSRWRRRRATSNA